MIAFGVWDLPRGKPRMTQRDKFNPSSAASRYWAWADAVRLEARKAMAGQSLLTGGLSFSAVFHLPIPASWPKKRRLMALSGEIAHTVRPDLKNLVAGVEDSCNGVIWLDDVQIVEYSVVLKFYATRAGGFFAIQPVVDRPCDQRYADALNTLDLLANVERETKH